MKTHAMKFELKDDEVGKVLWNGTVTMKVPLNHERLALMTKHGVHRLKQVDQKKLKTPEGRAELFEDRVQILSPLYGEIRHLIQDVELHGPEGQKVKGLEEFETHPELTHGFMVVALQYCEGFGPGKA